VVLSAEQGPLTVLVLLSLSLSSTRHDSRTFISFALQESLINFFYINHFTLDSPLYMSAYCQCICDLCIFFGLWSLLFAFHITFMYTSDVAVSRG
jgi:hypothetical protein